jgi:hypothetical protein
MLDSSNLSQKNLRFRNHASGDSLLTHLGKTVCSGRSGY